MKKALLLSALALAGMTSVQAQTTYPVPIERRVPWTIISGTDSENKENNPLGGKTGGIADLIDRNPISFWHSNPDDCDGRAENHSHWFMIDRGIGASNIPFDMLSIQQRIINTTDDNPDAQAFNGAVKDADIYVTDEFIGLLGGSANKDADDSIIYEYVNLGNHTPSLHIEVKAYTQEAQLFKFNEAQTGRFVLVVINHTINPNASGNEEAGQGNADQYACLSEFNLFLDTNRVSESNFDGIYSLGENPRNARNNDRRTHMLQFSVADATTGEPNDVNTDAYRYSPLLQTKENPWIPDLNWLDWQGTYFDITPLMTVSTGNGMKFQILANGAGNGLYKALYIDWDGNGFDDADKVVATESTGNLNSTLESLINVADDKTQKELRARYIVDNQNTSATPSATIGADGGIVVDFTLRIEKPVTFNVNMLYEGENVDKIENVNGYANLPFVVPTPDFFDVDVIAVAPETENEIDINLRRFVGLPFAFAQSVDDIKWQAIQQNYAYKLGQASATDAKHNFTWTYDADSETLHLETESATVGHDGFTDAQLWGFVGDMFNGFTIYNKAAGTSKSIYVNGSSVKIGDASDNNIWKAYYATGRDNAKYCAFKLLEGSDYIVFAETDGNSLAFNATANNAATCWFVAPATPLLEQFAEYNFDKDAWNEASEIFPESLTVGTYQFSDEIDLDESKTIADAATADPYDLEAVQNLQGLLDLFETNVEYIDLRTDKWYRIASAHNANGWVNTFMHTDNASNILRGEDIKDSRKHNYFSLFNFIPVPDADDRYFIQSQEWFVGHSNGNSAVQMVNTTENAGQFAIVDPNNGPAKFAIKDMTQNSANNCLHKGSANACNVTGWASGSGGSHFYILQADDVEVVLNEEINGVGHADFIHFPFPVTTTDDGSELYIIYAGYDNSGETSVPVVSYEKVNEVAANTPFMVLNQDKALVTLKINSESTIALLAETDEAEAKANVLAGTIRSKSAAAGDYILGHDDDGAIVFQKSADAPTVKSNYVYIPAANLGDEHSAADVLPLNDPANTDTTGISEVVEGAEGVKAVFDLQGRRLAVPAKGINIVNGKKVLVK